MIFNFYLILTGLIKDLKNFRNFIFFFEGALLIFFHRENLQLRTDQ